MSCLKGHKSALCSLNHYDGPNLPKQMPKWGRRKSVCELEVSFIRSMLAEFDKFSELVEV